MRDLLSSLSTNLHILVIAMLLVGLGLGMITGIVPGHGKTKQNQPVISLSTSPSVPPKEQQANPSQPSAPSNGPVNPAKPPTGPSRPSEHQNTTTSSSDSLPAPMTSTPPPLQLPCAMCDDTADCPDSCLSQASLPWRRPQPPITICCGGRKVSIPYQPDFVICPTACTDGGTGN